MPVKLAHECQTEEVVSRPEIRYDTPRSSSEERPHQARDAFLAKCLASAGVTCREGVQLRSQTPPQNLPCLEKTVVFAARLQEQSRPRGEFRAHDSMRREVHNGVLVQRFTFHGLFRSRYVEQNRRSRLTESGKNGPSLVVRRRECWQFRRVDVVYTSRDRTNAPLGTCARRRAARRARRRGHRQREAHGYGRFEVAAQFEVVDAPNQVQSALNPLKLEVQKYKSLVEGGLKQQVQTQRDQVPEGDLLKVLETEVVATAQVVQRLPSQVSDKLEDLKRDLRNVIQQRELQALNRVLKVQGKAAKAEPTPGNTYGATKSRHEAFNGQVAQGGAAYFENAGRQVHFGLWVDISSELEANTYDEDRHPDHADAIRELKLMKLLRSKLELR